jgi:hypothetical protein
MLPSGRGKTQPKNKKPWLNKRMRLLGRLVTRTHAMLLVAGHAAVVSKAAVGLATTNPVVIMEEARKTKARSLWTEGLTIAANVNPEQAKHKKAQTMWNLAAAAKEEQSGEPPSMHTTLAGEPSSMNSAPLCTLHQLEGTVVVSVDDAIVAARVAAEQAEHDAGKAIVIAGRMSKLAFDYADYRAAGALAQAQALRMEQNTLCEVKFGYEEPACAHAAFSTIKAKADAYADFTPAKAAMICSSLDRSLCQTMSAIAALVARAAAMEARAVWARIPLLPLTHAICRAHSGGTGDTASGVKESFMPLFWRYRRVAVQAENELRKTERWETREKAEELKRRVEQTVYATMIDDGLSEMHAGLFYGEVALYGGSNPWLSVRSLAMRHLFLHGPRITSSSAAPHPIRRRDGRSDVDGNYCQLCCERSSAVEQRAIFVSDGLASIMPEKGAGAMRAWCAVHDWHLQDARFSEEEDFGSGSSLTKNAGRGNSSEQSARAVSRWQMAFAKVKCATRFAEFDEGSRMRRRRLGFSLRRLPPTAFRQAVDAAAAMAAIETTDRSAAEVGGDRNSPTDAKRSRKNIKPSAKADAGASAGASLFAATAISATGGALQRSNTKMRSVAGALQRKTGTMRDRARARVVRLGEEKRLKEQRLKQEFAADEASKKWVNLIPVPSPAKVQPNQPTQPTKQLVKSSKHLTPESTPAQTTSRTNEQSINKPELELATNPPTTPDAWSPGPPPSRIVHVKVPKPLGPPGVIGLRWLNKRTVYRYCYGMSTASQYLYGSIGHTTLRPWRYGPTPPDAYALSKEERRARMAAQEAKAAAAQRKKDRAEARAKGMGKKVGRKRGKKGRKRKKMASNQDPVDSVSSMDPVEDDGKKYFWATRYASNVRDRGGGDGDLSKDYVPQHLRCRPSKVLMVCHTHAFNQKRESELEAGEDDSDEKPVEEKPKTGWQKVNKFAKLAAKPTIFQVAANLTADVDNYGIRATPRGDAETQTSALMPYGMLSMRSRDGAPFVKAFHGRRFHMLLPMLTPEDGNHSGEQWSMIAQLVDFNMHYNGVLLKLLDTHYLRYMLRVQYLFRTRRRKRTAKLLCRVFRRFLRRKFAAIRIQRMGKRYVMRKWAVLKIECMLRRRIWRKRRQQKAAREGACAALYGALEAWTWALKASAITSALAAAYAALCAWHAAKRLEYTAIAATRWQKRWRGHIHREYVMRYRNERLAMIVRLQYAVRWRQRYLRLKMVSRVQRRYRQRRREQAAAQVKLALCGTMSGWLWRRGQLNRKLGAERRRRMGEVVYMHIQLTIYERVTAEDRIKYARRFRERELQVEAMRKATRPDLLKKASVNNLDLEELSEAQAANAKARWAKIKISMNANSATKAFTSAGKGHHLAAGTVSSSALGPSKRMTAMTMSGKRDVTIDQLSSADAQLAVLLRRLHESDQALKWRRRLMRQTRSEGKKGLEAELRQLMDKGFIDEDSADDEDEEGGDDTIKKEKPSSVMVQVPQTTLGLGMTNRWRWVWNGYPFSLQAQKVHTGNRLKGWEWVHDVRDIFATYLRYERQAHSADDDSFFMDQTDEQKQEEEEEAATSTSTSGSLSKMATSKRKATMKEISSFRKKSSLSSEFINYNVTTVSLSRSHGRMGYHNCLLLLMRAFRLNLNKETETQGKYSQQKQGGMASLFGDMRSKEKKERMLLKLRAELMLEIDHEQVGYITLPALIRFLWKTTHVLTLGEKFMLREEMKQTEEAKEREREKRHKQMMKKNKNAKDTGKGVYKGTNVSANDEAEAAVQAALSMSQEKTEKEVEEVEDIVEEVADINSVEGFESARIEAQCYIAAVTQTKTKQKKEKDVLLADGEVALTPLSRMMTMLQGMSFDIKGPPTPAAPKRTLGRIKSAKDAEEVKSQKAKQGLLSKLRGNNNTDATVNNINPTPKAAVRGLSDLNDFMPPIGQQVSWNRGVPATVVLSYMTRFRAGEGLDGLMGVDGMQAQAPRFECTVCKRGFAMPSHYREHCAVPQRHEWRWWLPWQGNGKWSRGVQDYRVLPNGFDLNSDPQTHLPSLPLFAGPQKLSPHQSSHLSHNCCSEPPLIELAAFEKVWAKEAVESFADWELETEEEQRRKMGGVPVRATITISENDEYNEVDEVESMKACLECTLCRLYGSFPRAELDYTATTTHKFSHLNLSTVPTNVKLLTNAAQDKCISHSIPDACPKGGKNTWNETHGMKQYPLPTSAPNIRSRQIFHHHVCCLLATGGGPVQKLRATHASQESTA